jgi:endonuclease/exonuclease/phosphatase family metal-dependent hydrolase
VPWHQRGRKKARMARVNRDSRSYGMALRLFTVFAVAIIGATMISSPAQAARTIKIFQMNICNSGLAGCYSGERAVDEAKVLLAEHHPNVVFINEICRGQETDIAWNGNYDDYPATHFTAAWNKDDNTTVKCTNGADYGSAILVDNNYAYANSRGVYTSQNSTSEQRVYGCARFSGFFGCVTHLSTDEPTALAQCNELTKQKLPAFKSSLGEPNTPSIVSGDLNMEYDTADPENVQKCVPSGWTRKGDGDVQHVMVSAGFTGMSSRTWPTYYTDHNVLQITVTAPW